MICETLRYLYSGDQYITIEIDDEMKIEANFIVIGLDGAIKQANIEGVIETLPIWRSMLLQPGNRGSLLIPGPLRTLRDRLPSHGSSLSKASLCQGRPSDWKCQSPLRYTLTAKTNSVEGAWHT